MSSTSLLVRTNFVRWALTTARAPARASESGSSTGLPYPRGDAKVQPNGFALDEREASRASHGALPLSLLRFVHRGRDGGALAGARSDYESDTAECLLPSRVMRSASTFVTAECAPASHPSSSQSATPSSSASATERRRRRASRDGEKHVARETRDDTCVRGRAGIHVDGARATVFVRHW
jgi:hypothetical protein